MTANVNWHEAQTVCNDNGGHLPTISSEQENTFVYNMYSSHCVYTHYRYLGFHDGVNEAHFKWVDDSTSSYTKWRANEPNNAGSGEDCTHMYGNEYNREWNDLSCTNKYFNCFLCEDSKCACPVSYTACTLDPRLLSSFSTNLSSWLGTIWWFLLSPILSRFCSQLA